MPIDRGKSSNRRAWARWALRWGVPSAAIALGSVWVVQPDSGVSAIAVAGVALTALLVFVGTMPRRRPPVEPRARRGAGGTE
ncbi:hypothetical protein OG592_43625 (plasmid) [Streptomyces avidinii]|uniref:hypothetical protein n=1 Tax=Streptomyces avidinii TaxID=1895 RepID=UPI002F911BA0|nr:hypothetical protein OG592_43625 [Streptomyces avidinii]